MSKAFTSEETPGPDPVSRPPPRVAPGEVRWMTPEGFAALQAERARLAGERGEAARGGDAAERARRLAELDRRAALVEGTLAAVTVLGPEAAPDDQAAFATWVTVEEGGGARRTWRLVGPDEADPRRDLLSVASPVGRALLGRAAGDTVEVERPSGPAEFRIVAVRKRA